MKPKHEKVLNEYLDYLTALNRQYVKPKSLLKVFFNYAEREELDVFSLSIREAQDFQTYLSTKTKRNGKINYEKQSLLCIIARTTSFYDYLRKRKLVPSNPFKAITRIKSAKRLPKNILNEEDMNSLLSHLKEFSRGKNLIERRCLYKAHVIAELMYSTGARINEIESLRLENIDFYRGTVRIHDTKTGQERDAILSEYACKILELYVRELREYVLFGKNGGDMELLFGSKAHLQIWLNRLLKQETKKLKRRIPKLKNSRFTTHHFRHALGFHLLRGGCDIRYIQEILGHRELSTTQVYTKVDKEDLLNVLDKFHPRKFMNSDKD